MKANPQLLQSQIDEHIKKAWFLSYHLTEHVSRAAPLLITAWAKTIMDHENAVSPIREDFKTSLFSNIFQLSLENIPDDMDFCHLPIPNVPEKYQIFIEELKSVPMKNRGIYLMGTYGGLSTEKLSKITKRSAEEIEEILKITFPTAARDQVKKIRLSTEFRNPTGSGFQTVQVPDSLRKAILHKLQIPTQARKEGKPMATKQPVKKKNLKRTKIIAITAIVLVCAILAAIFIPKWLRKNALQNTTITTYKVESVSYGDVDTTISGSGTLTPISKETITNEKAGTVTAVNYKAGESVEEEAVIATLEDANGNTYDFTAPYDCVLLELPIAVEDELNAGSQIAMIMGRDGFTIGLAVDELDIATVAVGQEVSFTIDAVDGKYTGEVSAVSYNGTSSGGTTAFQITTKVDYVEGVYPGMSASAEIVIESSGEGLLVPVDAVGTSGDDNYVYLAPSDAIEGYEYSQEELDISNLTKAKVETGMSDGSYILIESDEIQEGDLIILTKLTSTQTGSDSEGQGGMGGFGGFGGMGGMGGFPGGGGGGMNFEDFDFENFDPGSMPQGGGFPGGGR